MDKKSIILVVILAVVVLFYWQILEFLGLHTPAAPPAQNAVTQVDTVPKAVDTISSTPRLADEIPRPTQATDLPATLDTLPFAESADTFVVITNKYRVVLTSLGGGPVSIDLKEHTYRDGSPVEMLPAALTATPELQFADRKYSTTRLAFTTTVQPGEYVVDRQDFNIEFVYTSESGGIIRRHFTFYPDQYHYDLKVQVENRALLGFERQYQIVWNNSLAPTEPDPKTDYDAMEAVAMMGGSREQLDDYTDDRLSQSLSGATTWAGLREKYFTAVIIPRSQPADGVFADGRKWKINTPHNGSVTARDVTLGLDMNIETGSAQVIDSFTIYVGPLAYRTLAKYDVGLEDMLGIGTTPVLGLLIKPFAIGIIYLLPIMYKIIPNYGIVIILFAIIIKLITLPLSMKSFKSMQAMKDLQPKMKELQEKHKKNPQALNAEMMKLYKKHGVNPMSGCLPMLPQMPIFFAMFSVFRATILLRDAPFFWFINDLSRGASGFSDPYIVLVVLMVGAQFVSQYFTMASTQQNKALMYMMPLMMGFFLYSFPAGLLLYWTMFSLLSLLDYFLFKRDKGTATPEIQTA